MRTARQIGRDARDLWRFCMVEGHLDEHRVLRVADALASSTRPGAAATLKQFGRLVKLECLRRSARIESALPLPNEARAALERGLLQRHGPDLAVTFAVDPSLIGGLRLTIGSSVYDASVKGGLAAIESRFQLT